MKFSQLLNKKDSVKEKAQTAYVRASKLFDERWYASRYQDVFKKLKDPARHYYLTGWKENRNPSESFDTAAYLRQYPECGICPIIFDHNRNDYADLAICAIVKNEAPYIKEWLDYHLMVGVKRFYIYDNESSDNLKHILLPYISQGIVIYQYYPGKAMQMPCYNEFLKEYGDKNEWVAFVDIDEFIIPLENATIPEFLADYKEYPGVGINWVSYDSDGHKKKPEGGVLENYTRVHYDENLVPFHLIKSIAQPSRISKIINPHFCLYKNDELAVNENKEPIGGELKERAYVSPFSVKKIRINHYYCKSKEEAEAKVMRGTSDNGKRKDIPADTINFPDYKYDYVAYKFVCQLKPEIAGQEELKIAWLRLKNMFISLKHKLNPSLLYDYIDEEWYFEKYPEAKESGMSAVSHYVYIGWRKGYNPSGKFDTSFYLDKYKDVKNARVCPLLHYINSGKKEGRLAYEGDMTPPPTTPSPSPDGNNKKSFRIDGSNVIPPSETRSRDLPINKASSLESSLDSAGNNTLSSLDSAGNNTPSSLDSAGNNTLSSLDSAGNNTPSSLDSAGIVKGSTESDKPTTPLFKRICDWCKTLFNGKEEYNELWNNKEYFDEVWYLANYAEAQSYKNGPKAHYRTVGWKKGFNPSAQFKTEEYLKQYPECKICPLDFEYNRNGYVDLSIVAIMRNEAPYVKEWIDYHRLVGVKRFYIYDNESTDNLKEVLMPYIEQGVVIYKYYPGLKKDGVQTKAYNECVTEYKNNTEWLAIIDADEFIVPKKNNNIPDFLKNYEDFPAVGINWICYDSNGYIQKPSRGVMESYTRCYFDDQNPKNHHIKCIVRPLKVKNITNPHNCSYINNENAVTENKEKIKEINGRKATLYFTEKVSVSKICINHYWCKSEEEYLKKIKKPRTNGIFLKKNKDELIFKDYKYDYSVFRFLCKMKPWLVLKETFKYITLYFKNIIILCVRPYNSDSIDYYFDEKWYLKQYQEVGTSGLAPLEHYLTIGWKKRYNPSEKFNTDFYLEKYKDVAAAGINPLEHYIYIGKDEGRLPLDGKNVDKLSVKSPYYSLIEKSELFNKRYYMLHHPLLLNKDLVEHYLTIGWKKGYNPSKGFNSSAYLERYQDVKKANINPLVHYLTNGKKEGRSLPEAQNWLNSILHINSAYRVSDSPYELLKRSKLFNGKWYLKQYPEVAKSGQNPISHYLSIGWKEGKNPSYLFNGNAYLDLYQDVKKANVCPLLHYIRDGKNEHRHIYSVNQEIFTVDLPNKWDNFICKRKAKNPLISIIVASYNYADIIGRTLDSLVSQTYKNFEVIVVDDGSKDDSVKVIKKYAAKYPFIKLHRHKQGKNMGLPATVKLGLEKSKGEYIAFCESDDYWDKNHLEEKVKIINNYADPKVIVNDVELFGDKERCEHINIIVNDRKSRFCHTKNRISVSDFRDKNWIVTFSCCMIKKSVLDECNIDGTPRGANLDWWIYRQVCCVNKVFYVNKKLTYWYIHNSYMVKESVDSVQKQENFLKSMDKILLKKHPIVCHCLIKYHNVITNSYQIKDGCLYHFNRICKYQPKFSVVMPTYNRQTMITDAVDSLLKQTYQNFELIIVDDGSTDGTVDVLNSKYSKELKSGKIKYIYKQNGGVCKARNVGLQNTSNEWIAYLDSDNILSSSCLEIFAKAILHNRNSKSFYSDLVYIQNKLLISHEFNYEQLLKENYIDLGVFVHHRTIYEKLGGFDENMTRLVDWDLVARYTKNNKPVHIKKVTLYYNDSSDFDRITGSAKLYDNIAYFRKKNCNVPVVTTMITSYNHQDYIREAIDSAIKQIGNFMHEIIISDDGSTDDTPKIIEEYARQYPHLIRNISDGKNIGISANMKKCFEAATGKYIAVLEGDDYWTDAQKLEKQMQFLEKNKDCSMVFSRVKVYNEDSKRAFLLDRHNNLPEKLTGKHFLKEMSLIVNFSCAMYRRDYLQNLPDILYEGRLSEIALAMYLENKGKIGFISTPLSVYRQNSGGVWSGSDKKKQLQQGLIARQTALKICADKYKPALQKIIDEQYIKLLKDLEEQEQEQTKQAV